MNLILNEETTELICMTDIVRIANKQVGKNQPVFIIAEAGVNHNGRIDLAIQLIDEAYNSGADAVKFQTFKTEELTTKHAKMADYQIENSKELENQFALIKGLELSYDAFVTLKEHCEKRGITFLSTPHTLGAMEFLDPLVPAFKIGSGDLTNLPFLKILARKDKPIILSTGMATLEEVREAVDVILKEGNSKLVLLHCVTNYPADMKHLNLRAIETLRETFSLPIGFSDHSIGVAAAVAAVALNACVLEKHFTLDKNLPGPDHKASMEPHELKELVDTIRSVERALGDGLKKPAPSEVSIKDVARKSLVARIDIDKGAILTEEMIDIKRPGHGIQPKYLQDIIGKRAKVEIKEDELLSQDMFE